jgi:hypothetical protein
LSRTTGESGENGPSSVNCRCRPRRFRERLPRLRAIVPRPSNASLAVAATLSSEPASSDRHYPVAAHDNSKGLVLSIAVGPAASASVGQSRSRPEGLWVGHVEGIQFAPRRTRLVHRVALFVFLSPLLAGADASVPADARLHDCLEPIRHAVVVNYDPKHEGQRCSSVPGELDCYGCFELVSEHNDAYDWVYSLQVELKPNEGPPRAWKSYGGDWGRVWFRQFVGVHASVSIHPCGRHRRSRLRREAEIARRTLDRCLSTGGEQ